MPSRRIQATLLARYSPSCGVLFVVCASHCPFIEVSFVRHRWGLRYYSLDTVLVLAFLSFVVLGGLVVWTYDLTSV